MGRVWFGVEIGIGVVVGWIGIAVCWAVFLKIRSLITSMQFARAQFTWEENLQGWSSRDPHNDDWILWDEGTSRMLRLTDYVDSKWRVSHESKRACLQLGRDYIEIMMRR